MVTQPSLFIIRAVGYCWTENNSVLFIEQLVPIHAIQPTASFGQNDSIYEGYYVVLNEGAIVKLYLTSIQQNLSCLHCALLEPRFKAPNYIPRDL